MLNVDDAKVLLGAKRPDDRIFIRLLIDFFKENGLGNVVVMSDQATAQDDIQYVILGMLKR